MDCILNTDEREELLLGYCSAMLELDTARTFERHIQGCDHCRELVEMQKLLDETLVDWQAPPAASNFDQKLFARIRLEQEAAQPWWRQYLSFQFGWKPLIPIALASIALLILLTRSFETSDTSPQAEAIRADEIEQVERALDDMEALQALHQQDGVEGAGVPGAKEKL